jgi:hypothetical protein
MTARARQNLGAASMTRAQLQRLVGRIHPLGPRPLLELFVELEGGADLHDTLESYAALFPLREFIRDLGGDRLPQLRAIATTCL